MADARVWGDLNKTEDWVTYERRIELMDKRLLVEALLNEARMRAHWQYESLKQNREIHRLRQAHGSLHPYAGWSAT